MEHRHLNHHDFTAAAVDDVIARGNRADWQQLRDAVRADQQLRERVHALCAVQARDPYAQRYHFWLHYTEAHDAAGAIHAS